MIYDDSGIDIAAKVCSKELSIKSNISNRLSNGYCMFNIEIKRMYWIKGDLDDRDDLCLHGDVVVDIGKERFKESCTVTATALYLLKSLTEDHVIHKTNQMLPCCGHFLIANETLDTVEISGCPNGVDWSIIHDNDQINIITENNTAVAIDFEAYKKIVYDFADKVQGFYFGCSPKIIPNDEFKKSGYVAFWNEWHIRRN